MKTIVELTKEYFEESNIPYKIQLQDDPSNRWGGTYLPKENVKTTFLIGAIDCLTSVLNNFKEDVISPVTIDFFDYCLCDASNRIGINFMIPLSESRNEKMDQILFDGLMNCKVYIEERITPAVRTIIKIGENVKINVNKLDDKEYVFNISMDYDFLESMNVNHLRDSIIDIFEDFLDAKGVTIDNDEKEDADDPAIIYGSDFDEIAEKIEYAVNSWLE
jgi:hypothetical protein